MATRVSGRDVRETVAGLRAYFESGVTKSRQWRIRQLDGLAAMLRENQVAWVGALSADLRKPVSESHLTEIGFPLSEIRLTRRRLRRWIRGTRERVPLAIWPATARTIPQPRGTVLIMGPWNYPLQLVLVPLVGALAAGNTVALKPSELAPATSALLAELLPRYVDDQAVAVVEGDVRVASMLLDETWDYIFYTGGPRGAHHVAKSAAERLTPVTLELGGKSPAFVDATGNVDAVARRLAWAKFLNAGQTCVAPDYLLVTPDAKDALVGALRRAVTDLFGGDPQSSADFGRIVNDDHYRRLARMLDDGRIAFGGVTDASSRYVSPTILTDVNLDSRLMTEEIFGPLLPMVDVKDHHEAIAFIRAREKPLALHVMSERRDVRRDFLQHTSSGALDVNVGVVHMSVPGLPFGGVGASGMGAYHGRRTFDTFSHSRAVIVKPLRPDTLRLIYPPYTPRVARFISGLLRRIS